MHKQPEMTEMTRQRIMDAFWAMALEEGVLHITASGAAKKAGVNRSTFYEYFTDVVDLTNQVEDQFLDDFVQSISSNLLEGKILSIEEFSKISLRNFPKYADKMFYFLGKQQSRSFEIKLRKRMMPFLLALTGLKEDTLNLSYIQTYVLSAMRGIFVTWYEEEKRVPIEELLPMGQKLVAEGILGYAESVK